MIILFLLLSDDDFPHEKNNSDNYGGTSDESLTILFSDHALWRNFAGQTI